MVREGAFFICCVLRCVDAETRRLSVSVVPLNPDIGMHTVVEAIGPHFSGDGAAARADLDHASANVLGGSFPSLAEPAIGGLVDPVDGVVAAPRRTAAGRGRAHAG